MPTENEFAFRAWAALCEDLGWQYGNMPLQTERAIKIIQGSFDAYMKAKYGDAQPKPRNVPGRNIPPSKEEVAAYFKAQASAVDPVDFWLFYDSKDWKVGPVPMKNWHSSAGLWMRRAENMAPKGGGMSRNQGAASLFALQAQLKTIETEMESILYPGGSQFKTPPTGKAAVRFDLLYKQRLGIKEKIDGFAQ